MPSPSLLDVLEAYIRRYRRERGHYSELDYHDAIKAVHAMSPAEQAAELRTPGPELEPVRCYLEGLRYESRFIEDVLWELARTGSAWALWPEVKDDDPCALPLEDIEGIEARLPYDPAWRGQAWTRLQFESLEPDGSPTLGGGEPSELALTGSRPLDLGI